MAAFSDFLETGIRDHFASDTQLPLEDTFVSLFTTDPTDAGTGTEVSGGSYARVQVNQDGVTSPFWADVGSDGMENDSDVTFPTATASWGTVTHFGIHDAVTTGNLLFHGALSANKTVGDGDTFKFATGDLDITFA